MANFNALQEEILQLKKEKNALVLAHYYVPYEVQQVADKVGDSFALAKFAKASEEQTIVMCGVCFMGESAKLLSPDKTVLLPDRDAGCPMADMITPEGVRKLRAEHPKAAVVCYVNSSAATKAESDICCTSSSALKVVKSLREDEVIFVPDRNLGSYIAKLVPEKEVWLYDGCCPIHDKLQQDDIVTMHEKHPEAKVAVHPECREDILAFADYIGSTAGILQFAAETEGDLVIGTECEIANILSHRYPERRFYTASESFVCDNMKKITLERLRDCLRDGKNEVTLPAEESELARKTLDRMVAIGG